jgi:cytochrome P450
MLAADFSVPDSEVEHFLNDIVFRLYAGASGQPGKLAVPIFQDIASVYDILGDPARFPKNMGLIGTLGDSRFSTNGQAWQARRDITQRAYVAAGSVTNSPHVRAAYETEFDTCEATPPGVHRAMMRASSAIFFRSLGCQPDLDPLLEFFDGARRHVKRLQFHSWNSPSSADSHLLKNEGRMLMRQFADRAFGSAEISALLATFADRAEGLENFDALEELLMNFFAGIETTTATLSFAIDRLASDPRIQQRLFDEIDAADEQRYLDCFIQETMRFFPPIPFVVREAAASDRLNGVTLRKDQTVLVSIVGLHHNGSYWNEPEIFDCSRAEFLNDSYNRRAFLPFLAGPRICGGAKLAKLELIEGLKAAVRHFTFCGRTDDVRFDYGLALRPKSWAEVSFSRRH